MHPCKSLPFQIALLIDPDPEAATIVREALDEYGFAVIAVPAASDAVALGRHSSGIKLAIVEVVLGDGTSGIELANTLQRVRVPVLLTSKFEKSLLAAVPGFSTYIAAFLQKPFTAEDLVRKLQASGMLRDGHGRAERRD